MILINSFYYVSSQLKLSLKIKKILYSRTNLVKSFTDARIIVIRLGCNKPCSWLTKNTDFIICFVLSWLVYDGINYENLNDHRVEYNYFLTFTQRIGPQTLLPPTFKVFFAGVVLRYLCPQHRKRLRSIYIYDI